jgi:hypothetical protein
VRDFRRLIRSGSSARSRGDVNYGAGIVIDQHRHENR